MDDTELLLSDEFVLFSQIVTSVHEEKKVLEDSFKKHFDDYKARKKELESKVAEASRQWEEWKKGQVGEKAKTK